MYVAGEWRTAGAVDEIRSPYSGDVVGRVAKAGAGETRRAIDAAERAMQDPLPAHKRAEILVKVVSQLGRLTQGVTILNVGKNDHLAAISVEEPEDEEERSQNVMFSMNGEGDGIGK